MNRSDTYPFILQQLTSKYLILRCLPERLRAPRSNIVILFHLYSLYFCLITSSVLGTQKGVLSE
jgi:hypothetical protein